MTYKTLLALIALTVSAYLTAEVQMVLIAWTPQLCQSSCAQGLQETLSQIPQVAHVDVDMGSGTATLTWRPNQPYSFSPINFATRVIGIPRILYAKMRVRGTIQRSQDIYNIISTGDNTVIRLLSPIQPKPGQYTIQNNIDSYPLTTAMKQQFNDIIAQNQTVIISGTIFQPVSYLFPVLIVESIKAEKPKE